MELAGGRWKRNTGAHRKGWGVADGGQWRREFHRRNREPRPRRQLFNTIEYGIRPSFRHSRSKQGVVSVKPIHSDDERCGRFARCLEPPRTVFPPPLFRSHTRSNFSRRASVAVLTKQSPPTSDQPTVADIWVPPETQPKRGEESRNHGEKGMQIPVWITLLS